MSKPPLFFIIIILLIVVAASFRFMHQRRENGANDAAPVVEKRMKVMNKREKAANEQRSRQREVAPPAQTMRYEASFRAPDGGLAMTFRLEAEQYHALAVGETGTLSYQGTRFIRFVLDPAR
ncbi:DUF2500 domain-containing protein [Franconibacter daqui]|uniref:DUF2500 domain-containing protein n=1 Tax=Franconibacter daqui TaxID=2047724 RepID=UPI0016663F11|nr:DUF2500 domain-containing protein [Franconibacter daqui]